ncbi:putative transcription initiation factor [Coniochaeta sp. 2T2.1]|nr:putative transcription initiation factor [Coniochaeta sp. 2T2.1]
MEDVKIKPDPEAIGSPLLDDDEFEDAGDLEFYDKTMPGDPLGAMWLARVPHSLWKTWSELDDDAEIHIGTIRQWNEVDAQGRHKLRMLLKSIPQHQNVPKEYDLEVNKEDARNTFIFSEQDLPGYAAKNKAKADAIKAGIPAYLMKSKNEKENTATSWERRKKGGVPPRKSIPKKTAIAGKVRHLVTGIPVENIETEMITRREREEAMKPKAETDIVEALAIDPRRVLQAGTEDVTNFIKTGEAPKPKRTDNKTTRMPENELVDALHACFRQYNFWSMKALRSHLRQPEAYLREVLDKLAVLMRTGDFANHYQLKPEFKELLAREQPESVPAGDTAAPAPVGEDDEDDEDIKMEDVTMS